MIDHVPPRLGEIIEDFQLCVGQEKLELLIQYAESLPSLPDWLQEERGSMESVPECMTPVAVQARTVDGHMQFFFDVPVESPTVRGFAAMLEDGVNGASPEEVLQIPGDFFQAMGLHEVLTHQRLNGLSAILAHMKQLAVQVIAQQDQSA